MQCSYSNTRWRQNVDILQNIERIYDIADAIGTIIHNQNMQPQMSLWLTPHTFALLKQT